MRLACLAVAAALVVTACAGDDPTRPAMSASPPAPATTSPEAADPPEPPEQPGPREPQTRRTRGVDVSHHQGEIDWARVATDGMAFAYLKATEGSTFSDPRFADNWAGADAVGLRVGGYHYYSLCSDPRPQAEHFAATLDAVPDARRPLPPVVDLELLGNCDPPPATGVLRRAVETFIGLVERRTGRRVVVYTHPDFDERYGFADELDRRRWVRRPGDEPPPGPWWLWQRSDDATVDGVEGPVDLDVMRTKVDTGGRGARQ